MRSPVPWAMAVNIPGNSFTANSPARAEHEPTPSATATARQQELSRKEGTAASREPTPMPRRTVVRMIVKA